MKIFKTILVLFVFFIFVYLRLSPIINKTVPYTYDQGRDFLKAEEIIRDKNLTFIGPTTGIAGVNHGAWWYYFLLIPYTIFNGWPQGFYLFLLIINSLANFLFYFFLNSSFGFIPAIFYLLTVSISPYFMRNAFFASNDMLAPMFVLLFIYSIFKLFEKKENKYMLFVGLSLGFILETELAFGIFLIPVSLITLIIFKQLKNIKKVVLFSSGFLFPMLPRLLFEVKNNFIQTKVFILNITSKKDVHPLLFRAVFEERSRTFIQYWQDLFYNNNQIISLVVISFVIYFFIFHRKILASSAKKILIYFILTIIFLLFVFSLFYQGNFFYGYYFQGLQYLFLMLVVISVYGVAKNKKIAIFSYLLVVFFLIINIFSLAKDISSQKNIPLIGLRADDQIVNYFIENTGNQYYCLRIYTPPVITYTYNYLFSYYARMQKVKYPSGDYKNNQCYYLIDKETYQFRINKWEEENIPKEAKVKEIKSFENGSVLKLATLN